MDIKLVMIQENNIQEAYKIKRKSEQYVGLIEDIIKDYNEMYKEYSDLYGIYLRDRIIGLVVLLNTPLNGKWGFTDLVIDEDLQHQGYGKKVTNIIIKHFKTMKEANIIQIEVFEENMKAISCYEKCGFKVTKPCEWNSSFVEMEINLLIY